MSCNKASNLAIVLCISIILIMNPGVQAFGFSVETGYSSIDNSIISGVVKENNTSLGYIILYFEDGSGTHPDNNTELIKVRSFTYSLNPYIIRDGYRVTAEDIKPGDHVFIKLDDEGYIQILSAKSYYRPVYGTVHNKGLNWIIIKDERGIYVNYPLSDSIPIYKNDNPCTAADILPGDRVRVLVQTDGDNLDIASIDIEKVTKPVTGIYRAKLENYDVIRDTLAISGVQEFVNGRWENNEFIGIKSIAFSPDYEERPGIRPNGIVYFATEKSSDGSDKIVKAAYRGRSTYEITANDNVLSISGNQRVELENTSNTIYYDSGTIAVKDGRLVDITAFSTLDPVKVSMQKSSTGNTFTAHVLVSDTVMGDTPVVYRGRIKDVDPTKTVTVESFARLIGITWSFTNAPKTFDIDLYATRLIEEGGIGNMRSFGTDYIGQTVYIVAEGNTIRLISTAPYADSPISGRIVRLTGGTYDSEGNVLTHPTTLTLKECMVYDTDDDQWDSSADLDLTVPTNAIVIKKGQVGTTSLLRSGDEIKVIRHSQNHSAILILCD